jgi:hypothetical protein
VFIGGIMVLFLYIASLRNEGKLIPGKGWALIVTIVIYVAAGQGFEPQPRGLMAVEEGRGLFCAIENGIILVTTYLLVVLIAVVKGVESFKGAVIKKF